MQMFAAEEAAVDMIAADTQGAKTWQSRISFHVKQFGHVRNFLLVVADVRHEVEFLEAVQDNVAADEQERENLNSCT